MADEDQTGATAPPIWKRIVGLLPSLLLLVVALNQLHLARTAFLDPWKGGGFGMFSTNDGGRNRHTHVLLIGEGGEMTEIFTPRSLEDLEDRMLALPDPPRLAEFSRRMAGFAADEGYRFLTVHLEIWRTDFDPETLEPREFKLRDFDWVVDGDGS
jgi:hypothetical protein